MAYGSFSQILRQGPWAWLIMAVVLGLVFATFTHGQLIDGFTEPFRSIQLSSDESGAIIEMPVEEGSQVDEGDVIARLDDRIQQLQLELAEHLLNSKSELDAARRAFKKREAINDRLQSLRANGHASESEIIRSEMELSIAKAKYLAAQEDTVSREIEFRRAKMLLERRRIRAPFAGAIAEIHRFQGEFVSPLRPEIVTLVQTDVLLGVFNVPGHHNYEINIGDKAKVIFPSGQIMEGEVYSVGVVIDAESGTYPVKVKLDNQTGQLKSGEQCQLEL